MAHNMSQNVKREEGSLDGKSLGELGKIDIAAQLLLDSEKGHVIT